MRGTLEQWSLLASFFAWLASVGADGFRSVFAPLMIVALAMPLCVVASLLLVAWLMTPAMVRLVAARRFPTLERRQGGGFLAGPRLVARLHRGRAGGAGGRACRSGSFRRWCWWCRR